MATISSFDLWQKDVFFLAAEEVQESTEKLESVYRMWERLRSDESESEMRDEMFHELRIVLGTAKWQLDEFERAVSLRHEDSSAEKYSVTRHKEFVSVLGDQISNIEKAVNSSLEERKQPLSWVQLDKEERDDLECFLSGPLQTFERSHDFDLVQERSKGYKETVTFNKDSRYVVEVAPKEICKSQYKVFAQPEQLEGGNTTWSSPDICSWKIVIADELEVDKKVVETKSEALINRSGLYGFVKGVEAAAKSKLSGKNFSKGKSEEHLQLRGGLSKYFDLKGISRIAKGITGLSERSRNCFKKCNGDQEMSNVQPLIGRAGALPQPTQSSQKYTQYGRSLHITILLLLTIILVVPFALYST